MARGKLHLDCRSDDEAKGGKRPGAAHGDSKCQRHSKLTCGRFLEAPRLCCSESEVCVRTRLSRECRIEVPRLWRVPPGYAPAGIPKFEIRLRSWKRICFFDVNREAGADPLLLRCVSLNKNSRCSKVVSRLIVTSCLLQLFNTRKDQDYTSRSSTVPTVPVGGEAVGQNVSSEVP